MLGNGKVCYDVASIISLLSSPIITLTRCSEDVSGYLMIFNHFVRFMNTWAIKQVLLVPGGTVFVGEEEQ